MPRLELNIEVADSDRGSGAGLPVAGTVQGEDGEVVAFVGWVGLLSLIEQALAFPAEVRDVG